jgi:hypothetical protein
MSSNRAKASPVLKNRAPCFLFACPSGYEARRTQVLRGPRLKPKHKNGHPQAKPAGVLRSFLAHARPAAKALGCSSSRPERAQSARLAQCAQDGTHISGAVLLPTFVADAETCGFPVTKPNSATLLPGCRGCRGGRTNDARGPAAHDGGGAPLRRRSRARRRLSAHRGRTAAAEGRRIAHPAAEQLPA